MKTKDPHITAIGILCVFVTLVIVVAFLLNSHYPVLVISGESSVGTWMSGVLLVASAMLAMVLGMQKGWFPWFLFVVFFFILALDERFMFHEQLKEKMIFSLIPLSTTWHWIYELPVLIGSLVGVMVTILMWRQLRLRGKMLLLCAVFMGSVSVAIDILCNGVFIEDSFKLLAELCITSALVGEVGVTS